MLGVKESQRMSQRQLVGETWLVRAGKEHRDTWGLRRFFCLTTIFFLLLFPGCIKSKEGIGGSSPGGSSSPRTPVSADIIPPTLSGIDVSRITPTSATIHWVTDEVTDGRVEYGTEPSYGRVTPLDTAWMTTHEATLTGLKPNTLYHFSVRSVDGTGNLALSEPRVFITLGPFSRSVPEPPLLLINTSR
jgi:hypothetical protein